MSGWPPTPALTSGENSGYANRKPSSLEPLHSQGRWESQVWAQPASLGGPDNTGDDVTLSTLQTGASASSCQRWAQTISSWSASCLGRCLFREEFPQEILGWPKSSLELLYIFMENPHFFGQPNNNGVMVNISWLLRSCHAA